MKCRICNQEYQSFDEAKACYSSHQTSEENEVETPTLDALKGLLHKNSDPVRRIQPKKAALEGEETEKGWVDHLIGVAKDGNGKLTLPQIRWELQDKSITLPDVLGWFTLYAADVHVEPHPGNTLYLTFGRTRTAKRVAVNSMAIITKESI